MVAERYCVVTNTNKYHLQARLDPNHRVFPWALVSEVPQKRPALRPQPGVNSRVTRLNEKGISNSDHASRRLSRCSRTISHYVNIINMTSIQNRSTIIRSLRELPPQQNYQKRFESGRRSFAIRIMTMFEVRLENCEHASNVR